MVLILIGHLLSFVSFFLGHFQVVGNVHSSSAIQNDVKLVAFFLELDDDVVGTEFFEQNVLGNLDQFLFVVHFSFLEKPDLL